MNHLKKSILCPLLAAAVLTSGALLLTGCGTGTAATSQTAVSSRVASSSTASSSAASAGASQQTTVTASMAVGAQLELPEIGEEIAVVETTQGTIRLRLFPKQAPKAVENFKALAQQGDYNGVAFHRVINGFMIQTGKTASGKSSYGGSFADEFDAGLLNLRGAVSMANTGRAGTNTTQFFINQATAANFPGWDYYAQGYEAYQQYPTGFTANYGNWPDLSKVTDEVKALYTTYGGNPTLDGAYTTTGLGHTVFAQVFDGMDVVDKIAAAETDSNNAPVDADAYRILSITFVPYEG